MKESYVRCKECGEIHTIEEVEFLNIEEDMEGRDVITFSCPTTLNPTTSLVYIR